MEAPSPPFTEVAAEVTLQKEVGGGSGSGAWKTTLPQTQNLVRVPGALMALCYLPEKWKPCPE